MKPIFREPGFKQDKGCHTCEISGHVSKTSTDQYLTNTSTLHSITYCGSQLRHGECCPGNIKTHGQDNAAGDLSVIDQWNIWSVGV